MAKNTMMGWLTLASALMLLLVNAKYVHAVQCDEATLAVAPCKPFLVNNDRKPSSACCTGLQGLEEKITSKPDLQDLCECLKKVGLESGFRPERAQRLPQFCGASFPADPAVDCSKIA